MIATLNGAMTVLKRDGKTYAPYDKQRLVRAVTAACEAAHDGSPQEIANVVGTVHVQAITNGSQLTVERLSDMVEIELMRHDMFEAAKAYILYRHKRHEMRNQSKLPDPEALSNYIHYGKYSRHVEELHRREVYAETVARDEGMHIRKFPHLESRIRKAFSYVYDKRLLPSMRSMQFGGIAIEINNARMYNCCFSHCDRPRFFQELLWLLLSGCGTGYSVQYDHVDQLPVLTHINMRNVKHHIIGDSIEGWADAIGALVESFMVPESEYYGKHVEFSYHMLRNQGMPLKVSGGRAPGHLQLKESIERIRHILKRGQGRKLRPIECHDIGCLEADAVLSGGIRRSAMIALFSLEDSEMMYAKTGDWAKLHPWRKNSNNSVMIKRDETKWKSFKRIFEMTKEWGEPGFYFCDNLDHGANPCFEIGLDPRILMDMIFKTGWAFCNLVEMNAARFRSRQDFEDVARQATFIATLQATYTSFPYLGPVSEAIVKRDALLGISMCGMMRTPTISCNPTYQREIALKTIEWNREDAKLLGINPAARITCVKPGGTGPLELGIGASGHGADHAPKYIRRVIANEDETVFLRFRSVNPHMCVRKPDGDWVIEFPMAAPPGAIVKGELSAIQFLEMVKSTQLNWVLPGTARPDVTPGLKHNVSNTVIVKPEEWDGVADYLWHNRQYFTGVALLPATGDKDYAFAPHEAVVTEADLLRWHQLIANYKPLDYTTITEDGDSTDLQGELACAGGVCELK